MNQPNGSPLVMRNREKGLVTDLFLAAREKGRPYFAVEQDVEDARRWLKMVLSDCDAFDEHLAFLGTLFGANYRRAPSRRDRPRGAGPRALPAGAGALHVELPDEGDAVVRSGVGKDVLSDDKVAELLLSPFMLEELADRINDALPEAWLDDLADAGRAMRERYDLPSAEELVAEARKRESSEVEIDLPGMLVGTGRLAAGDVVKLEVVGPTSRALKFGEAALPLKRRLAEHAYGDAGRDFALTLHAMPAGEVGVAFELAATPVPSRNSLEVAVTFPGGHRRVFTVEVPPEVREAPPDEWRPSMHSLPCEPVPVAELDLKSGAWAPESGPPVGPAELFVRSGGGDAARAGRRP